MSDYGLVASSGGFLEVGDEGLGRLAYSRGEGLCSQRKKIKGLKIGEQVEEIRSNVVILKANVNL